MVSGMPLTLTVCCEYYAVCCVMGGATCCVYGRRSSMAVAHIAYAYAVGSRLVSRVEASQTWPLTMVNTERVQVDYIEQECEL